MKLMGMFVFNWNLLINIISYYCVLLSLIALYYAIIIMEFLINKF